MANVPRVGESTTVRDAFELLRRERYDSVELICMLGREDKLKGVVAINALAGVTLDRTLGSIMPTPAPSAHAETGGCWRRAVKIPRMAWTASDHRAGCVEPVALLPDRDLVVGVDASVLI